MTFLSAEWRNLAMANYVIDPTLLQDYVPANTELDYFQGRCYVSLVGFMFLNTKVMGIPIPFHQNFEEVNLRFYVRYKSSEGWRRGVVFIKEIVPRFMISLVANAVYREPYVTMQMSNSIKNTEGGKQYGYTWGKNYMNIEVTNERLPIADGSEEEFITEHYFGYTRWDATKTKEYEVKHPRWLVNPVKSYDIQCDFGGLYGERFATLRDEKPHSVLLAEGSPIAVMMNTKA
jgi:uncharacterized protein YqjF (DUF2071 family)